MEVQIDNNKFAHDVLIANIQNDVKLGIDFLTITNVLYFCLKMALMGKMTKFPV